MQKLEAKACPNCGHHKVVKWQTTHGLDIKTYYLECKKCHWCGASRLTIRGATRAWNRGAKMTEG